MRHGLSYYFSAILIPLLLATACGGDSVDADTRIGDDSHVDGLADARDSTADQQVPSDVIWQDAPMDSSDSRDQTQPDVGQDLDATGNSDQSADLLQDSSDLTTVDNLYHEDVSLDTADTEQPPETLPMQAVQTCEPTPEDACGVAGEMLSGLRATYRKDYYLLDADYNEYTDYPTSGGRFQVAGLSATTGIVTAVFLDGEDVTTLVAAQNMEWYHVWPSAVEVGRPVWFNFHSRDSKWDSAEKAHLVIQTAEGAAVDADFNVAKTKVPLTYVTTDSGYGKLLVHVHNFDLMPRHMTSLYVNGREVYQSGLACVPDPVVMPGQSAMWSVDLCEPWVPGQAWTVVAEYSDAGPAVGAGRVMPERFPIEAWANSDECAFPTGDVDEFNRIRNASIDTTHFYWGLGGKCDFDVAQLINEAAPAYGDVFLMVTDDFRNNANQVNSITTTAAIMAFFTGDESDGEIYDDNGYPNPANKAAASRHLWSLFPEIPTYNGAKTNGHIGSFAGMADVQGIDLYIAACAPHITSWGKHPPIGAAYDYLLNARNNHMPLPTWQYAQGLSPVWNKDALIGGSTIHVQPDPQEIWVQAISVMAAGGKGLMWFQVNGNEAEHKPERWQAIADASRVFRGVRELLRVGDLTSAASSDDKTLVDAIRGPDAIVVPVVSLAGSGPTDALCGAALLSEALVPHWKFDTTQPSVTVRVPDDFTVYEVFEVKPGSTSDPQTGLTIQQRDITFSAVTLTNAVPARVLVLAANPDVRTRVEAAMIPPIQP